MPDALGWRARSALSRLDEHHRATRRRQHAPAGVTNHFSRIAIPDTAETFWDGSDGAERRHQRMLEHTHGVPVILGSTAPRAAFGDDAGSTRHSI